MLVDALWWVVVPMKDTRHAKSRLGGSPAERRQLAIVMARDTLCAVVNATRVEGTVVVCEREDDVESFQLPGVTVLVRPGLDLNQAITAAATSIRGPEHTRNLAVVPGDLPYLRSSELDVALAKAATSDRACVADRTGHGTTLLTARACVDLVPAYGAGSLQAHRASGATTVEVPAWSGLRRDVDERSDLTLDVSLGHRTRTVLARRDEPRVLIGKGA